MIVRVRLLQLQMIVPGQVYFMRTSAGVTKAPKMRKNPTSKPGIKPARRVRRTLWCAVILLALIGIAVVVRRTVALLPILVNGYTPPAPTSNPVAAQFAALDDIF